MTTEQKNAACLSCC